MLSSIVSPVLGVENDYSVLDAMIEVDNREQSTIVELFLFVVLPFM